MPDLKPRFEYHNTVPEVMQAMIAFNKAAESSGLEHSLLHLVKIRASQINGCSFCLNMHNHEALADGEDKNRLFLVAAWRESPLFTGRERAALAWTEAVTQLSHGGVSDALYTEARRHFTEEELVKLNWVVAAINVWNRMSVAFHIPHPVTRSKAA